MKKTSKESMDSELSFQVVNFDASYSPPINKINVSKNLIQWGDDNKYPDDLLSLYNLKGGTSHSSIINKKCSLIAGKGFKKGLNTDLNDFAIKNKLRSEIKKIVKDYEIMNSFSYEIIWNNAGTEFSISHIQRHKLRIGIESDDIKYPYYWYCNDWAQSRKDNFKPVAIRAFDPEVRNGKQVYIYNEYNPSADYYPIPGYSSCINWMEIDGSVPVFHLNQLKQGYAPSGSLTLIDSKDKTESDVRRIKKRISNEFAGETAGGKIFVSVVANKDAAPIYETINQNDSDKKFILLSTQVETQIVQGHEVPQQLVILTAGKLGSTNERNDLLEEFNISYVRPRQKIVEDELNDILSLLDFNEDIKLESAIDEVISEESDVEGAAKATLRGTVGGVQALQNIIISINQGDIGLEQGIAIVVNVFGFSEEKVREMLPSEINK